VVPAHRTGCLDFQAETLSPPLVLDPLVVALLEEPLVVGDAPSKFRTICSLLLEGRFKVTCSALVPGCQCRLKSVLHR
jgi:hypothetical protein